MGSDVVSFKDLQVMLEKFYLKGKDLPDAEVRAYQKQLVSIGTNNGKALGATSKKDYSVEEEGVVLYVNKILEDGYNLKPTKLSADSKFIDLQQSARYKDIIKDCVQQSSFSVTMFKCKWLSRQRSNIEHSNTLHTLRQNVEDIIGPLKMLKELNKPLLDYKLPTEDELLIEIEQLKLLVQDQRRVIDELTAPYDPEAESVEMAGQYLVDCVEELKDIYGINDTEACKRLEVSRSTLTRTRKELKASV